jgi:hypothetical protein
MILSHAVKGANKSLMVHPGYNFHYSGHTPPGVYKLLIVPCPFNESRYQGWIKAFTSPIWMLILHHKRYEIQEIERHEEKKYRRTALKVSRQYEMYYKQYECRRNWCKNGEGIKFVQLFFTRSRHLPREKALSIYSLPEPGIFHC